MTSVRTLQSRVQNTAKILDKQIPGWWHVIDLESFDITSGHHCIVAQLVNWLGGNNELLMGFNCNSEPHAFSNYDMEDIATGKNPKRKTCTEIKQSLWKKAIKNRRKNPGLHISDKLVIFVDNPNSSREK